MNIGQAMAICHEINSDKYSDEDKAFAVYQVMNMTTHMSISKEKMIEIIKWLWNLSFEVGK